VKESFCIPAQFTLLLFGNNDNPITRIYNRPTNDNHLSSAKAFRSLGIAPQKMQSAEAGKPIYRCFFLFFSFRKIGQAILQFGHLPLRIRIGRIIPASGFALLL